MNLNSAIEMTFHSTWFHRFSASFVFRLLLLIERSTFDSEEAFICSLFRLFLVLSHDLFTKLLESFVFHFNWFRLSDTFQVHCWSSTKSSSLWVVFFYSKSNHLKACESFHLEKSHLFLFHCDDNMPKKRRMAQLIIRFWGFCSTWSFPNALVTSESTHNFHTFQNWSVFDENQTANEPIDAIIAVCCLHQVSALRQWRG